MLFLYRCGVDCYYQEEDHDRVKEDVCQFESVYEEINMVERFVDILLWFYSDLDNIYTLLNGPVCLGVIFTSHEWCLQ